MRTKSPSSAHYSCRVTHTDGTCVKTTPDGLQCPRAGVWKSKTTWESPTGKMPTKKTCWHWPKPCNALTRRLIVPQRNHKTASSAGKKSQFLSDAIPPSETSPQSGLAAIYGQSKNLNSFNDNPNTKYPALTLRRINDSQYPTQSRPRHVCNQGL